MVWTSGTGVGCWEIGHTTSRRSPYSRRSSRRHWNIIAGACPSFDSLCDHRERRLADDTACSRDNGEPYVRTNHPLEPIAQEGLGTPPKIAERGTLMPKMRWIELSELKNIPWHHWWYQRWKERPYGEDSMDVDPPWFIFVPGVTGPDAHRNGAGW